MPRPVEYVEGKVKGNFRLERIIWRRKDDKLWLLVCQKCGSEKRKLERILRSHRHSPRCSCDRFQRAYELFEAKQRIRNLTPLRRRKYLKTMSERLKDGMGDKAILWEITQTLRAFYYQ